MVCRIFLICFLAALPLAAYAVEAPQGQVRLDSPKILRGAFTEERQKNTASIPLQSSGHFAVAPGYGLIWSMEQPFPTSTIITAKGVAQDIGGVSIKLSAKNISHLYDMIGGALAGNWHGLENDFIITPSKTRDAWQMLLTPRPDVPHKLSYSAITVSGSRFVEHIVMTKMDGSTELINFSDEVLSSVPPTAEELKLFTTPGL